MWTPISANQLKNTLVTHNYETLKYNYVMAFHNYDLLIIDH